VSDNGAGFDTTQDAGGHGLRSMRMRCEKLNGELDLETAPGNGTRLCLTAPLNR